MKVYRILNTGHFILDEGDTKYLYECQKYRFLEGWERVGWNYASNNEEGLRILMEPMIRAMKTVEDIRKNKKTLKIFTNWKIF